MRIWDWKYLSTTRRVGRYGERPYRTAAEDLAIHTTVLRSIAPTPAQQRTGATGEGMVSVHSIGR